MVTGRIQLKKRLGQHHLLQGHLCAPMLDFLAVAGRQVIEIGPGGGVLTDELLGAGAQVIAVELDPTWAFLVARGKSPDRLKVVVGDALELDWNGVDMGTLVTGNLPYSAATVIIERLLREAHGVRRAAFLVQHEVAMRLAARPGESDYGALSVLVAARAQVSLLGRIGKGSFRPPPKVDGGMVGLERRAPPLPEAQMAEFEGWVRSLFGMRRKALRNSLGRLWSPERAKRALVASEIDGLERPEQLSLDAWVRLFAERRSEGPTAPGGC